KTDQATLWLDRAPENFHSTLQCCTATHPACTFSHSAAHTHASRDIKKTIHLDEKHSSGHKIGRYDIYQRFFGVS
ncbi:MAG: hypothetical protein OQL10_01170, partial [Sedimenticola sp.]|nr:hypothetical protein [Sedimenticola sp.]